MAEKKWIKQAIKKPGALHEALHVPMGEQIPHKMLLKAAQGTGVNAKRARLALTLSKMHK